MKSASSDEPLTQALRREHAEVFRMFRDAVNRLDDSQWTQGEPSWTEVPARAAMHTLLCAEYYIAPSPDGFDWKPGGVQYGDAPVDQLPSRDQTLASIERLAAETDAYLIHHGDDGLLHEKAETDPVGRPRFAWMIYAVRHLQHHVAQISAECKRRGLGAAVWG